MQRRLEGLGGGRLFVWTSVWKLEFFLLWINPVPEGGGGGGGILTTENMCGVCVRGPEEGRK